MDDTQFDGRVEVCEVHDSPSMRDEYNSGKKTLREGCGKKEVTQERVGNYGRFS